MNTLKQKKYRDMNFELLRIISMIMVVTLHYMYHGGALGKTKAYSLNWFFSWTIETLSIVSVDCFILISGYFLIKSQFKLKKLLRLWFEILFYSLSIYIILLGTGLVNFNAEHLIHSCLPVLLNQYWFATTYIALYIFSPFLNITIHALNKNQMRNLLIILFVILSVCPTILPLGTSLDKSGGYSITHFIFLYFIASYIRLHWNSKLKNHYFLCLYLLFSLLLLAPRFIFPLIGCGSLLGTLYQYDSIPVVLAAISLFMYFRGISIKNDIINKIIRFTSGLTFAVYLIHDNDFIRETLYKKILHSNSFGTTSIYIPVTIASIIGIFIVCILIDAIRKKIFVAIENSKFSDYIEKNIIKLRLNLSNNVYKKVPQTNSNSTSL